MTIQEAANEKRVVTKTIRRWIAEGLLPAERYGSRCIRIRRADLDALGKPIPVREAGNP